MASPPSSSPATTAPTRLPGTSASSTRRATTRTCASWRSTRTTRSGTRATPTRRCGRGWRRMAAGRCRTYATRRRRWRAPTARRRHPTSSYSTRGAPSATAARPTRTTATPRRPPPGCAGPSRRCMQAATPIPPRPGPWAAASNGGVEHHRDELRGVSQVRQQRVRLGGPQLLEPAEAGRDRDRSRAGFPRGLNVERRVPDQHDPGGLTVLGRGPLASDGDEAGARLVGVRAVGAHLEVEPALEPEGAHLERRVRLDVAGQQGLHDPVPPV